MFRKTLITFAAAAAALTTLGAGANAEEMWRHHRHHNGVNIGIGIGGFGPHYYNNGFYDNGFYDDNYGQACGWEWRNVKRWNSTHTRFLVRHKKVWSCY